MLASSGGAHNSRSHARSKCREEGCKSGVCKACKTCKAHGHCRFPVRERCSHGAEKKEAAKQHAGQPFCRTEAHCLSRKGQCTVCDGCVEHDEEEHHDCDHRSWREAQQQHKRARMETLAERESERRSAVASRVTSAAADLDSQEFDTLLGEEDVAYPSTVQTIGLRLHVCEGIGLRARVRVRSVRAR